MPKRLLIINCSARKTADKFSPAIERYQSPVYFVVRRFLRQNTDNDLVIWILSGKYGLISADKKTIHYNQVMTEDRGRELKGRIFRQFAELMMADFRAEKPTEVFCHLSTNYQIALEAQIKYLEKYSRLIMSRGRPGEKTKMLKDWLENKNQSP